MGPIRVLPWDFSMGGEDQERERDRQRWRETERDKERQRICCNTGDPEEMKNLSREGLGVRRGEYE